MEEWDKKSNAQILKVIGASIKGRRVQNEKSQQELSKLSGVSKASITRLETGKGNISLTNLISIAKALGIANELQLVFKSPEVSPAQLAKAKLGKIRQRVRNSKKDVSADANWRWGDEDEK